MLTKTDRNIEVLTHTHTHTHTHTQVESSNELDLVNMPQNMDNELVM